VSFWPLHVIFPATTHHDGDILTNASDLANWIGTYVIYAKSKTLSTLLCAKISLPWTWWIESIGYSGFPVSQIVRIVGNSNTRVSIEMKLSRVEYTCPAWQRTLNSTTSVNPRTQTLSSQHTIILSCCLLVCLIWLNYSECLILFLSKTKSMLSFKVTSHLWSIKQRSFTIWMN
jgi:hypothetical protein